MMSGSVAGSLQTDQTDEHSTKLPFYLVDVFASEPLTGNPLAVVDGGQDLDPELLKRIAREFNQAETTAMLPPTQNAADRRLRSFTQTGDVGR